MANIFKKSMDQAAGFLPMGLLACSLALNVCLGIKLKQIPPAKTDPENLLRVGKTMPTLHLRSLDGGHQALTFRGGSVPTIVYVFTPSCIWCQRNLENAIAVEHAAGKKYDFIGLSLTKDGLDSYVAKQKHLQNIFYPDPSAQELAGTSQFDGTPETIVVGQNGTIQKIWQGAYSGSNQADIQNFFQTSLPGLIEPTEPTGI